MDFKNGTFLAKRLRAGDTKAYDYLMDSRYQHLCAYAYSLTGSKVKAEDIVQNVFVKLWIGHKKINPKYSIKSYLYKSVYNEFIDDYRKNKPVIYLEEKYLEAVDLVVENEENNFEELIALINKAIDDLPKKCKQVFLLNKKEGLTHLEISEYLGISVKTIEGHMAKAFKTLAAAVPKADRYLSALLALGLLP